MYQQSDECVEMVCALCGEREVNTVIDFEGMQVRCCATCKKEETKQPKEVSV